MYGIFLIIIVTVMAAVKEIIPPKIITKGFR